MERAMGGRGLHASTSEKEKRKEGEREEVATQPLVVPACFFALVSSTSFSLTKDLNIRYLEAKAEEKSCSYILSANCARRRVGAPV